MTGLALALASAVGVGVTVALSAVAVALGRIAAGIHHYCTLVTLSRRAIDPGRGGGAGMGNPLS